MTRLLSLRARTVLAVSCFLLAAFSITKAANGDPIDSVVARCTFGDDQTILDPNLALGVNILRLNWFEFELNAHAPLIGPTSGPAKFGLTVNDGGPSPIDVEIVALSLTSVDPFLLLQAPNLGTFGVQTTGVNQFVLDGLAVTGSYDQGLANYLPNPPFTSPTATLYEDIVCPDPTCTTPFVQDLLPLNLDPAYLTNSVFTTINGTSNIVARVSSVKFTATPEPTGLSIMGIVCMGCIMRRRPRSNFSAAH